VSIEREWSKSEIRDRYRRGLKYPLAAAVAGGVIAYVLSDFVTAILVFVAVTFSTVAGLLVGLRVSYWYASNCSGRTSALMTARTIFVCLSVIR
jgi:hypothetical protein